MDAVKGTITRRLDSALDSLETEFCTLCDRKDFENKLVALKAAEGKSDWPSKLSALFEMFDLCGISYERGRDYVYYEKLVQRTPLPTFQDIENEMLLALYRRYRDYPSPEDYMRRMVDRFSSREDGWDHDTLRVRILKQFIKYGNYLADVKIGKDKKISGRIAIRGYVKKKTGKKTVSDEDVLRLLDDDVFLLMDGATKEQRQPDGRYGLLKICDDLATGKFRPAGATRRNLYLFAIVYGMTYYLGYWDEAGESTANSEISAHLGHAGDIIDYATDIEVNLFDKYYVNNLIRFITEAASGTVSEFELDPSGQGINYKNFAEMIYLYYIANGSSEMTPLEKIRKAEEMIRRVQDEQRGMETENENRPRHTGSFRKHFGRDGRYLSEQILDLDEASFEQFILENYNCIPRDQGREVGIFQVEPEQRSAFRAYEAVLTKLIRALRVNAGETAEAAASYDFSERTEKEKAQDRKRYLAVCNYGLWFTDVSAQKKYGFSGISSGTRREKAASGGISGDEWDEFVRLLIGMNRFIGYTVNEEEPSEKDPDKDRVSKKHTAPRQKIKALFVSSDREVTRSSIVVAWYYYYTTKYELPGSAAGMRLRNFKEVFNEFKAGVDPYLAEAYYQPFSGRNLFDVLTAFSAYAYINL